MEKGVSVGERSTQCLISPTYFKKAVPARPISTGPLDAAPFYVAWQAGCQAGWRSILDGVDFDGIVRPVGGLCVLLDCPHAAELPTSAWGTLVLGQGPSFLQVLVALILALLWSVPVGVAIGTNRRLATFLLPVVQVVASIPATALFPVYLLFNIISGASAIPQDLKYTSTLIHLNRRQYWQTLILAAIYPYLNTGAITASWGCLDRHHCIGIREFQRPNSAQDRDRIAD